MARSLAVLAPPGFLWFPRRCWPRWNAGPKSHNGAHLREGTHSGAADCEAATDVCSRIGRSVIHVLAEKASTSRLAPITAEVRPSPQARIARRQPMLVLALDAGLARFWQKRPARAALSHVPPRKVYIPSTFCEAATDVGIREGRGLYPILAEKASTSRFTIVTAEVRPSSQVRIARRQPSQVAALLAGLSRFWQKRPARAASVQLPPRLTLHPKVTTSAPDGAELLSLSPLPPALSTRQACVQLLQSALPICRSRFR